MFRKMTKKTMRTILETIETYQIIHKGFVCMVDVSDFISLEEHHERHLAEFMQWEYILEQSKGSAYDFVAKDTSKIEAKFDWDSIKTGNHYLEFAQTNDNKSTWVPSGFALSADEADYWVVINEDWLRMYRMDHLQAFIKESRSGFKIKETRSGVNHNREGQFSRAYIIPFVFLDEVCFMKIPNPVARNPS